MYEHMASSTPHDDLHMRTEETQLASGLLRYLSYFDPASRNESSGRETVLRPQISLQPLLSSLELALYAGWRYGGHGRDS